MFHDSHQLDGVISQILDSTKNIAGEFPVSTDARFRCGNADVSLIDPDILRLLRPGILENIFFFGRRIPESSIINGRDSQVLGDPFDPSWQSLDATPIWE